MEEIYLPEKNMGNYNLQNAKRAKQDEFYTQLEDIEKELRHYDFKGKKVYCNCDNPSMSNFYKYFKLNFNYLGIKELISTGYNFDGQGYYGHYDGVTETIKNLEGNGDFRSEECIQFLKESDVVVTNPPFSLFREYVAQLMEYGKKFLIIGNQNAITYKEIFPYIKNNELWMGLSMNGSNRWFQAPDDYEVKANAAGYKVIDGKKYYFVNGVAWFTNIPHNRRNTPIDLYRRFYIPLAGNIHATEYPKYDNYDAIEVSKVSDIPMDYDGVMGVPITFLYKYCPTQFEIVGLDRYVEDNPRYGHRFHINGKETYARILIRRR